MPQHPPLYYIVAAVETTAMSAYAPGLRHASFDMEVAIYRLLNALFIAPLPLVMAATARRLSASKVSVTLAALFPLGVPMLVHIGASVSNDNLLTLLFALVALLLAKVWRGDQSVRTATLVGVLTALALLTKAFAFVLLPWVALSYGLAHVRTQSRLAISRGGLALAVGAVGGGWWWIRNLRVYGSVLPSRGIAKTTPDGFEPDVGVWLLSYLEWMNARFWGWFGWVDVRLPDAIVLGATAVVLACVVVGLSLKRQQKERRSEVALLIVPLVTLLVLVGWNSFGNYVESGVADSAIQGRYLFPGVAGLGVAVAAGADRVASRWRVLIVPSAIVAVAAVQVASVGKLLAAFWGASGSSTWDSVEALLAWMPWPPVALLLFGLAGAVTLSGTLVMTMRDVAATWRGSGSP